MKNIEKIIALIMLLFAIGFNLWLYRNEPTSQVDPNDNAFQYALVDRTNEIWNYADRICPSFFVSRITCHISLLTDHWVPNWAQGYNLPYYYSHIPQILIVGSYRFFSPLIANLASKGLPFKGSPSLFQYYHIVIYLLLSLFPLSMFVAMRVLKLPWLTAGIAALFASHISTDGLYGLDQSSYLWRGWGLSSQLFSAIFFPLALAYSIRFLQEFRITMKQWNNLTMAILFLVATTAGHLGIGMMAFLTVGVIAITPLIVKLLNCYIVNKPNESKQQFINSTIYQFSNLAIIVIPSLLLLSYWIGPAFLNNIYHNISVWDPVWKFNSYGIKEVLVNLWNGNLFDFGRLPIFTVLVLIGAFICAASGSVCHCERSVAISKMNGIASSSDGLRRSPRNDTLNEDQYTPYLSISLLFFFFLALYFGRTTWGNILNIIPGMSEFHQHRFIVGVHLVGLFLAPIAIQWILQQFGNLATRLPARQVQHHNQIVKLLNGYIVKMACIVGLILLIYPQTISYSQYNDVLIKQANNNYNLVKPDVEELIATIKKLPPGRVYAGRGGNWGKNFRVAETPVFMHLSTYGIPTILWLPETWSLNSDTEQYFDDNNESHYSFYNVSYVVTPPSIEPKPFWKLIKENKTWKLYTFQPLTSNFKSPPSTFQLPTSQSSYITTGFSPSIVYSDKQSFINVVRLWIQSDYPKKAIFPELHLTGKKLASQGQALRSYFSDTSQNTVIPHFFMLDEVTYQTPDGKQHSLFAEPPTYLSAEALAKVDNLQPTTYNLQLLSQSSEADIVFSATIDVPNDCQNCVAVLKQTYHPNWRATVDNRPVQTFSVFPFFTAVPLKTSGTHTITFIYTPSPIKTILLFGSIVVGSIVFLSVLYQHFSFKRGGL